MQVLPILFNYFYHNFFCILFGHYFEFLLVFYVMKNMFKGNIHSILAANLLELYIQCIILLLLLFSSLIPST